MDIKNQLKHLSKVFIFELEKFPVNVFLTASITFKCFLCFFKNNLTKGFKVTLSGFTIEFMFWCRKVSRPDEIVKALQTFK